MKAYPKQKVTLIVFVAMMASIAHAAPQPDHILSFDGIGVLKIGMDVTDAQKLSGKKISGSTIRDVPSGYQSAHIEGESYYLSLVKGKIGCIHITDGNYATPEGIKIGDDIQKVKEAYKTYPISSKAYEYQNETSPLKQQAEQLTVSGKNNLELLFRIYHHKVGDILLTQSDIQALNCKL